MAPYTFIDSFAGLGGFSSGLKMAGLRPVVAIEVDGAATAETYAANHPDVDLIRRDIRNVPIDELRSLVHRRTGGDDVDAVVGGPPCQIHSYGGSSRCDYDPERLFLYRQMIRIAEGLNARVILFENVLGILTKRVSPNTDRLLLDQLRADLDATGYTVRQEYVLTAWHYGVPQNRCRWFCVASRLPAFRPEPPIPYPFRPTVGDAFVDLPEQPGTEYTAGSSPYSSLMRGSARELTWHTCPSTTKLLAQRFALVPPGTKLFRVWREMSPATRAALRDAGILPRRPPHKQTAARLARHLPSWTVTSHVDVHIIHPTQDRILTAREVARLQSFADDYILRGRLIGRFVDQDKSVYEQLGAAVPPLMAYAWGTTIRQSLDQALGRVQEFPSCYLEGVEGDRHR